MFLAASFSSPECVGLAAPAAHTAVVQLLHWCSSGRVQLPSRWWRRKHYLDVENQKGKANERRNTCSSNCALAMMAMMVWGLFDFCRKFSTTLAPVVSSVFCTFKRGEQHKYQNEDGILSFLSGLYSLIDSLLHHQYFSLKLFWKHLQVLTWWCTGSHFVSSFNFRGQRPQQAKSMF